MTECDGRWFVHFGIHVLWSDDEDELSDLVARGGKETICLGPDYVVMVRQATGQEMLVPDPKNLTDRQRVLVLQMVEASMRKASMQ